MMHKVYLVCKRDSIGVVNLHSMKAFSNKQDAIEYLTDNEYCLFGEVDSLMMFVKGPNSLVDDRTKNVYFIKEIDVRNPGDNYEASE